MGIQRDRVILYGIVVINKVSQSDQPKSSSPNSRQVANRTRRKKNTPCLGSPGTNRGHNRPSVPGPPVQAPCRLVMPSVCAKPKHTQVLSSTAVPTYLPISLPSSFEHNPPNMTNMEEKGLVPVRPCLVGMPPPMSTDATHNIPRSSRPSLQA